VTTIGFVGAGNMACALGGGLKLTDSSAGPTRLVATDVEEKALARFVAETGGAVFERASDVMREADVVILAVKPQVLPALLAELAPLVEPRHLVISIAAGITLAALSRGLGERTRIVRAMPNTPALIREGMTVLVAGAAAAPGDLELAERIFRAAGAVATVAEESLLDPVTALSGSGPGFLFAYAEAMLRAGAWAGWAPTQLMGTQLHGKRLGIAGMGRIGQAVAKRALAFGMTIHYHGRRPVDLPPDLPATYHADDAAFLAQCDYLSIHMASTPETRKWVNARRVGLLPKGAIVVNSARGDLVDDEALIQGLASGHLGAVGLDVFAGEPNIDKRYLPIPNAMLLPHLGSATVQTRCAMGFRALDNLDAHFAGQTPGDKLA